VELLEALCLRGFRGCVCFPAAGEASPLQIIISI